MNVNQFDEQARRAAQQVVAESTEAIRSAALALYSDLQTDAKTTDGTGSPVASGRFAGSLRLSINAIDTTAEPAEPRYRYRLPLPPRTIPNVPISRVAALLRTFRLGDTIWISNSVPYVRRIEIGGHSWQTPDGVFAPTVRRWLTRFANLRLRVRIG